MISTKVCMIGAFAVGKTSLVTQFVQRMFSDRYLTTVGVRIDTREIEIDGQQLKLILWDIAGRDEFSALNHSYIAGASAYLLVVDGTRASTLIVAAELQSELQQALGNVPYIVLINKGDLRGQWEVTQTDIDAIRGNASATVITSAKTGEGVEVAFEQLARAILKS